MLDKLLRSAVVATGVLWWEGVAIRAEEPVDASPSTVIEKGASAETAASPASSNLQRSTRGWPSC